MPNVWIPSLLRDLTGGQQVVNVAGGTVKEVIEQLELSYPGIQVRLMEGGQIRPALAVIVDGHTSYLKLRQPLSPSTEIHFITVLGGG